VRLARKIDLLTSFSFCPYVRHERSKENRVIVVSQKERLSTMMNPAPDPLLSAYMEVYENERRWVGGGFSKKGLFPTERGPFSTDDGSLSWKTLDEAGEALLGKGWIWPDDSQYEYDTPDIGVDCDENGWRYAIDFSPAHLIRACSSQGMAHWVRRRRIRRRKVFEPKQLTFTTDENEACLNCDSEAVDALSSKLLETLSFATLLQRDAQQHLTDAIALLLKDKLIDSLGIGSPAPNWSAKVDSSVRLQNLLEELDKFPRNQQNVLVKVFQGEGTASIKGLTERMVLVSSRYFDRDEREAISDIVVCQLDPECALHCGRKVCNDEECVYFRVACPNEGCDKMVSRKHLEWHATKVCSFTIIDCPNGCGESFPRNQREAHMKNACGLRGTQCPFYALGCTAVVPARERAQHVEENAIGHMMLAATKMEEYQKRLVVLEKNAAIMERETAELKRQMAANAEKHNNDVARLEKQLKASSRQSITLEKKLNSEIRSHKK